MSRVVLLTGSNMGDKARLLENARKFVEELVGPVTAASHVYESAPWGFSAEESFLNQVLIVETNLAPIEVLNKVQAIEKSLGRLRKTPVPGQKRIYESRPIDIDILFYDNIILESERLTIPHPLIPEREFVLIPLCEVMKNYIHPVLQKPLKELLNKG